MDIVTISIIVFSLFVLLLILGMPVAFVLATVGLIGLSLGWGGSIAMNYLATTPYREAAHYTMATVPLFLLMGQFASQGGISRSLFETTYKWVGRLPGGLAMATILASAGFAAASGSSTAAAAAFSPIVLPEMKRYNYNVQLSMGAVAASGTFALMIPPSISFIVYGIITQTSIGKLFIAGIIPGIISAFVYIASIWIRVKINPSLAPLAPSPVSLREKFVSLKNIWTIATLILIVIGGLYGGVFTPTEAGAAGASGALIIVLLRYKMNWAQFQEAVLDSVKITAMIFMIIIGAFMFGYFLTLSKMPQNLIEWISGLNASRWTVLFIILFIYIIFGMFMDQMAIMVLTIPLVFPLITSLQFNPIWFGVVFIKTVEIGLITPPLGLNVYVIHGVTKQPMEEVFKGIFPFFICDVLTLLLLLAFPQIALFLPGRM